MLYECVIEEKIPVTLGFDNEQTLFHWHEEILEIILVIEGNISLEIAGEYLTVNENELIFINKMMPHKVAKSKNALYLTLHIDLSFFKEHVSEADQIFFIRNPNQSPHKQKISTIRKKIASLYDLCEDQVSPNNENEVINTVKDILTILTNNYNYLNKSPSEYSDIHQFNRIWSAFRLLLDNHQQGLTLSQVADKININGPYLSQCIKQETGLTFEDWLNMYRSEHAARLLLSESFSITRISYESGFSDPRYFNKYFKTFFNSTPSEYREKNKTDSLYQETGKSKLTSQEINRIASKMRLYKIGSGNKGSNKYIKITIPTTEILNNNNKISPFSRCLYFKDIVSFFVENSSNSIKIMQQQIGFEYICVPITTDMYKNEIHLLLEFMEQVKKLDSSPLFYCNNDTSFLSSNDAQDKLLKPLIIHDLEVFPTLEKEDVSIPNIMKFILDDKVCTRFNYSGLPNALINNGLKTPLYNVLLLSSMADGNILCTNDNSIVSVNCQTTNILLWTGPDDRCEFLINYEKPILEENMKNRLCKLYEYSEGKHMEQSNLPPTLSSDEKYFINSNNLPKLSFFRQSVKKNVFVLDENQILLLTIPNILA